MAVQEVVVWQARVAFAAQMRVVPNGFEELKARLPTSSSRSCAAWIRAAASEGPDAAVVIWPRPDGWLDTARLIVTCQAMTYRPSQCRGLGVPEVYLAQLSRRTMAGSMRDARYAGSQLAIAPITLSTTAAPTSVMGSRGPKP